jgi:transcriptional regulator with XRE-family HTH domain
MIRTMPAKPNECPKLLSTANWGKSLCRPHRRRQEPAENRRASRSGLPQLQKYEKGINRIPIDRLVVLAAYLEVPLLQLIAPSDGDSEFQRQATKFSSHEFRVLMEVWEKIAAPAAHRGAEPPQADGRRKALTVAPVSFALGLFPIVTGFTDIIFTRDNFQPISSLLGADLAVSTGYPVRSPAVRNYRTD